MIDFSNHTETRDGTPIVAGPWRQPQGGWFFVYQDFGKYGARSVYEDGRVFSRALSDCGQDLIPPEPEWEWRIVTRDRVGAVNWLTLPSALYSDCGIIGLYRIPKGCTDVTQWEYMTVEKAKELEGIE